MPKQHTVTCDPEQRGWLSCKNHTGRGPVLGEETSSVSYAPFVTWHNLEETLPYHLQWHRGRQSVNPLQRKPLHGTATASFGRRKETVQPQSVTPGTPFIQRTGRAHPRLTRQQNKRAPAVSPSWTCLTQDRAGKANRSPGGG